MAHAWSRICRQSFFILFHFFVLHHPILPALAASDAEQSWKVTEETLANGLTVLLLEDHRAPIFSQQVWYKVGSRNERPGITGISHLLEHLMFRGTPKYGPGAFSKLVQATGGTENAFTSDDQTVYFENTAAPHIDLLLSLEADRMVNLNLDETGFQSERKIVMEERRLRTADEPAADLLEQVQAAAYTAHPYGWPVVGWMSDLEALTLEDVKRYRQLYYAPDNAMLIIAGDINPETLLPRFVRNLAMLKQARRRHRSPQKNHRSAVNVASRSSAQLRYQSTWQGTTSPILPMTIVFPFPCSRSFSPEDAVLACKRFSLKKKLSFSLRTPIMTAPH
jgi:predicted Zn-dependent peptidase